MPHAELNGIRLYYEEHGRGTPLVLIHGFSGAGLVWNDFLPAFAERFRAIVPDLRGHGRSTGSVETIHHERFAEDMVALLDQLKIERAHFVGHSSGGMTMLFIGARHIDRVRTMTLASATLHYDQHARRHMLWVSDDAQWTPERIARADELHGPGRWQELRQAFRGLVADPYELPFLPKELAAITCPTLVIHGDRDAFFPVYVPVSMYENMPNAELCILPNTGHGLPPERPKWFTEITLDFLERHRDA